MRLRSMRSPLALCLLLGAPLTAQSGLTLPPSADNQKSTVTQGIGLVTVSITYNSPDVTGPTGEDRTGKIWGQLVPWGMAQLGFGTAKASPWRAGANENTVFTVSHDVEIEGQKLPAGSYGFHVIPEEKSDWTLIFSKNSTSWGSFFYDPAEDALRVKVAPQPNEYTHWLTYDFVDRRPDRATVALKWEKLRVPFTISVPNIKDYYLASIREELRSSIGFSWQSWDAAAQYCLQNDLDLDEALTWAEAAISAPFIGQANFTTLQTKAAVLSKLGRGAEAETVLAAAIDHPTADVVGIHMLGRRLQAEGNKEKALEVFKKNAAMHPGLWPVDLGLARGYADAGNLAKALEHAKIALNVAPDDPSRNNVKSIIAKLEKGETIN